MAVQTGKVLNVMFDMDMKSQAGKPYKAFALSFVDSTGRKVDIIKPMMGLRGEQGAAIRAALETLTPGDEVTVQTEMGGSGYKEIVGVYKGSPTDNEAVQGTANNAVPKASNPYRPAAGGNAGRDFETAEERKLKQRLIVRQAALNQALEFAAVGKWKDPSFDTVVGYAEQFENWVYRGL